MTPPLSQVDVPLAQCASPGCPNSGVLLVQLMGPQAGPPFDLAVFCLDDAQDVAAHLAGAGQAADLVSVGA